VKKHSPEEIEQLGVAGYLRKPYHQRELLDILHKLLNNHQNSNALCAVAMLMPVGTTVHRRPFWTHYDSQRVKAALLMEMLFVDVIRIAQKYSA
jgi:DNA-binding response OmpR family regulator